MAEKKAKAHRTLRNGDKGPDVKALQNALIEVAKHFPDLTDYHVIPDGEVGAMTLRATHRAGYITGLAEPRLKDVVNGHISISVQTDLRHPNSRTDDEKKRGDKRRTEIQKARDANEQAAQEHGNVVTFDGKPCARWIAEILADARNAGSWKGQVVSGFRTPEYSTSLCMSMCGQPTCPGRCGGAASNHSCPPSHACSPHEGAVDVSDPAGLQAYCRAHNLPLHGNGEMLPSDTPHFSNSGR